MTRKEAEQALLQGKTLTATGRDFQYFAETDTKNRERVVYVWEINEKRTVSEYRYELNDMGALLRTIINQAPIAEWQIHND